MKKDIKNKIYIRWLGAFGSSQEGLLQSLNYEFETTREVACEPILNSQGFIFNAAIGLLIDRTNIVREFKGDIWSIVKDDKLVPTRKGLGTHREAFANPIYKGIVLKREITPENKSIVLNFCKSKGLDLYFLNKNGTLLSMKERVWKF